jgi:hypothetical protein
MCMHGCRRHYFVLDRWLAGGCRCGCMITPPNSSRMLWNMIQGKSHAKSVLCIGRWRFDRRGSPWHVTYAKKPPWRSVSPGWTVNGTRTE